MNRARAGQKQRCGGPTPGELSPGGSKELEMTEQLTHMHRGSNLKRTGG